MMTSRLLALGFVLLTTACAAHAPLPPVATKAPGSEQVERGLAHAKQGDDLGAEQYFASAIRAGYPEPRAMRLMVSTCIAGGRLERARTHAQRYAERHPEDWIFLHVLASIYFAEADGASARATLELLLADHPTHAPSEFLLALVMRDQYGDMDGARRAFERYLALAPAGEHHEEARAWVRRSHSYPARRAVRR